jgi:hypothetical protein
MATNSIPSKCLDESLTCMIVGGLPAPLEVLFEK